MNTYDEYEEGYRDGYAGNTQDWLNRHGPSSFYWTGYRDGENDKAKGLKPNLDRHYE